jgi:hypothetical protein
MEEAAVSEKARTGKLCLMNIYSRVGVAASSFLKQNVRHVYHQHTFNNRKNYLISLS